MKLPFRTVDVFTTKRFAGNPLAIVEQAEGLETATMQTLAREFNLSETIFVQKPADPAHTAKVRIFFPTAEIPFAGHPTIGCAIHLAQKLHPGDGDFDTVVTLEEVAGLVPVKVTRRAGHTLAQLTAPVIPHAHSGVVPSAEAVAAALGIDPSEIGFRNHRPGIFAGGPAFVFVPLASLATLAKARPMEPQWGAMMAAANTGAAYLYTPGGRAKATHFSSRMYAPYGGIPEDPATGSATTILAANLLAAGELREGANSFAIEQGYDMGRPSDLGLEIDVAGGKLTAVRLAGSSVPVAAGEVMVF